MLSTQPRFDTEAQGNTEMVYWTLSYPFQINNFTEALTYNPLKPAV